MILIPRSSLHTGKLIIFRLIKKYHIWRHIFWDIMACSLLKVNGHFAGIYRLHFQDWKLSQSRTQHKRGNNHNFTCCLLWADQKEQLSSILLAFDITAIPFTGPFGPITIFLLLSRRLSAFWSGTSSSMSGEVLLLPQTTTDSLSDWLSCTEIRLRAVTTLNPKCVTILTEPNSLLWCSQKHTASPYADPDECVLPLKSYSFNIDSSVFNVAI
jgi:hypothetical protein